MSGSNAPSIYHLRGMGGVVGASGGAEGFGGGVEYNMSFDQNNNKTYHGVTVSAGYGVYPTIAEVHGEVGQTWVAGCNIYDVMILLVYMLKE